MIPIKLDGDWVKFMEMVVELEFSYFILILLLSTLPCPLYWVVTTFNFHWFQLLPYFNVYFQYKQNY